MKLPDHRLVAALALTSMAPAFGAGLAGDYVGAEEPGLRLHLTESGDGRITGTLCEEGEDILIEGRRKDEGFSGSASQQGERLPVTARLISGQLLIELGPPDAAMTVVMVPDRPSTKPASGVAAPATAAVIINGRALDAAALHRAETTYHIRIPAGRYWYDPILGAWGAQGGPTMGFLAAGLDLGGPVPPDASGGGTGVFVNGRELHPYDQLVLQQITGPITAGRYFITSSGLAGLEGGPPLWNLAQLATRSADNPTHTWQSRITGASGFSDGTTGAVFLPNGGIVSTGQ